MRRNGLANFFRNGYDAILVVYMDKKNLYILHIHIVKLPDFETDVSDICQFPYPLCYLLSQEHAVITKHVANIHLKHHNCILR